MQFRKQGDKIQVLKYATYDKDKRRAVIKMIGSFDCNTFEQTEGLTNLMTPKDLEQFHEKIDGMRKEAAALDRNYTVNSFPSSIVKVYDCIKTHDLEIKATDVTKDDAVAIYGVIKALTKALETAGHPVPKRAYKTKG